MTWSSTDSPSGETARRLVRIHRTDCSGMVSQIRCGSSSRTQSSIPFGSVIRMPGFLVVRVTVVSPARSRSAPTWSA